MSEEKVREFLAFHRANPAVYEALERLARQAVAAGKTKGSIALFYEQLRWEDYLRVDTDDPLYRLNNSWRPFYARYLLWRGAVPPGFFEVREGSEDE